MPIVQATRAELAAECWRRAELSYKLYAHQRPIYNLIRDPKQTKTVLLCARRTGKTTTLLLDAWETALRYPGVILPYMLPYGAEVYTVVEPIVRWIQADAPKAYLAIWNGQKGAYCFPNGSQIYIFGTERQQYEARRGIDIPVKAYIDEAGQCQELRYTVYDILMPAAMTKGGKLIISGTPPRIPSPAFFEMVESARASGDLVEMTIDANKTLSPAYIQHVIDEHGGRDSTTVRRELYCEFVADSDIQVIPEFDDSAVRNLVIEHQRPEHYQVIGALDPGFRDFTGYLLGYYDFLAGFIIVEAEAMLKRQTTEDMAKAINALEAAHFQGHVISGRYSDTSLQVIADLSRLHGIETQPTAKDNRDAQINAVRTLIQRKQILINPRCKQLIKQLRICSWNKARTEWIRTEDDGHFDLVAALIYLIRNIDKGYNPYPAGVARWFETGEDERAKENKDLKKYLGRELPI